MTAPHRVLHRTSLALGLLAVGICAHAQSSDMGSGSTGSGSPSSSSSSSSSPAPASSSLMGSGLAGRGYLGLNLGSPRYSTHCGGPGFNCDNPSTSFHLYGGAMMNDNFGLELGYLNMGNASRAGGTTKAQGVNFSVVGRAPLSQSFAVFGKLGATYGHTSVSADPSSGVTTGTKNGLGLAYGAGVSFDFTPQVSAVLEWDRHDFRFAGDVREPVKTTSVGLQYKF